MSTLKMPNISVYLWSYSCKKNVEKVLCIVDISDIPGYYLVYFVLFINRYIVTVTHGQAGHMEAEIGGSIINVM
jgi:hypothetical protein